MLNNAIRILNFDDSLIKQKHLLGRFHPIIIDLKSIAAYARYWVNKKTAGKIKNTLDKELRNAITFLGSGDFHHISSLLIDQFEEPINVILFDHHPDWNILPPRIACASWVSDILRKKNIDKVIILCASSADIGEFSIEFGDLHNLKDDRIEIYPYSHRPTRIVRRIPKNLSFKTEKSLFSKYVYWQELKDKNLEHFLRELIKRLTTKQVYVSIDKDCLSRRYALTNWEEGRCGLEELLLMLKLIKDNLGIVGLDIVGDYSSPRVEGMIKSIASRLDHPKDYSAKTHPEPFINSINEETNMKILELLKY